MRVRQTVIAAAAAAALIAVPTLAAAESPPTPGGGPAFGQHVAGMAPEHPREHGAAFGACVSAMASRGTCPHHD